MEMKNKYIYFILIINISILSSCRKEINDDPEIIPSEQEISIPENFDFRTTKTISLNINTKSADGSILAFTPFQLKTWYNDEEALLFTSNTNKNGTFKCEISIPTYIQDLIITTDFIGLPPVHFITIEGTSVNYTIGSVGNEPDQNFPFFSGKGGGISNKYAYLGKWDSKGVPLYKKTVRDVIPQAMLNDINATLPEGKKVPNYNPQYLADDVETNTNIIKKADVWVTFVHEGAGYKNALGFYTYPTDNPPKSVNDIDSIYMVFPNVSFDGSGGGLVSGDKVHIGQFEPNTTIGYCIIADGYNYSAQTVGNGRHVVYTNKDINPESNATLRQHNVMLYDEERDVILLGFEDIKRDQSGCDNDFNDAVFYVTSNPIEAIEAQDLETIAKAVDTDGDGVIDSKDPFPFDPDKSSVNYSPTSSTSGSLCFEDLWPSMGDYDFNDLVIDYQYTFYTNSNNEVSQLDATFSLRAIGASYENGFGFQLDIDPNKITSATGAKLTENMITTSSNGTESSQSKATFIVFDNAKKHLVKSPGGSFSNTEKGVTLISPAVFNYSIKFASGITLSDLGSAPYNPFIFVNGTRDREVHMVNNAPTDLASTSYFGTMADDSNPDIKRYYKNKDNMPWVLHIPQSFAYPYEKTNINSAYFYFKQWAESSGRDYTDWHNTKTGYFDANKIFN